MPVLPANQKAAQYRHVLENLLQILNYDTSPLDQALRHHYDPNDPSGTVHRDVDSVLSMSHSDIDSLKYQYAYLDNSGNEQTSTADLPKGTKALIKTLQAYVTWRSTRDGEVIGSDKWTD